MTEATEIFERERPRLRRLAYRMLGSVAEAEDAVQDAWLRWDRAGATAENPQAWLMQTVTRICLDRLKSARARRETYVGPWLPEPLIEEIADDPVEKAEDVSVAFLLALERLSPLERAVFLLHDVFDQDYAEIARQLGRAEPAVRQLAARARSHVKDGRPRFTVSHEKTLRLAAAFMNAAALNDTSALSSLLAEDAIMISDGGGKRPAALRPMVGREDVMLLINGLINRNGGFANPRAMRPALINGVPGVVMELDDGLQTMAFEAGDDGLIAAIYIMRNPDKLGHVRV
jgi:RNA polymerase sigma-70 factor (ECF subfamily)